MIISIAVAMDKNGLIGSNGRLPWHNKKDLQWFRTVTLGKPIIMGRKTYESLPRRPLTNRQNIVITRNKEYDSLGCDVVYSVEDALRIANGNEIMICGGAEIYKLFLPMATRFYVSLIEGDFTGDAYFPCDNLPFGLQSNH